MSKFSWTEEGTLYSEEYEDIYYHDGQGLDETEYVFLAGNDIRQRLQQQNLVIGELGFGTGLNFLTTWQAWRSEKTSNRLTFVSCEKHPLSIEFLEKAHSSFPELNALSTQLRSKLPPLKTGFHFLEFEEGKVGLLLMLGDAVDVYKQFEGKVDAWYLDGFAPSKNPEMWSEDLFCQMARHSHNETTLATFTAAGFVRRGLAEAGFKVERIKGFGYKKHMTIGRFEGHDIGSPTLDPWFKNPEPVKKLGRIAVIGAGIAGLNTAYSLARLGGDVTVFERNDHVASEASGNNWGMMYPLISKKVDRLGTLTKSGCFFTLNQLKDLDLSVRKGLLEYHLNDKKKARLSEAMERFPQDYLEAYSAERIGKEFSFESEHSAVLHHYGATFSPKKYSQTLEAQGGFKCVFNSDLQSLEKLKNGWRLHLKKGEAREFDLVVLANAYATASFNQTEHLPLRVTRGQVVNINREQLSQEVEVGLNFVNYLVKDGSDGYILGATFQVDDHDETFRSEDSAELVKSVEECFPGLLSSNLYPLDLKGRVCFRAVLKDYFPLVGPVSDKVKFCKAYEAIKHGKPKYQYPDPPHLEGLFVIAGMGARGLSTAALMGTYLARMIADGLSILPEGHITAVQPNRFLIKALKKS